MRKETIKRMTVMAMLMALSVVLISAVHTPLLPSVSFLEYDPGDVPILIGTMAYGPAAGMVLTVVAALIQGTFISTTGPWGILMHIIGTGSMVLTAGGIYKARRTKGGAVLGLILGHLGQGPGDDPCQSFHHPNLDGRAGGSGRLPDDHRDHPAELDQGGHQLRHYLCGI